jgi:hypothetical protein
MPVNKLAIPDLSGTIGTVGDEGYRIGAEAARRLTQGGRVRIGPGLTDAELDRVEREFGFAFAEDHRAFLRAGLPLNDPDAIVPSEDSLWPYHEWPDWRGGDRDELRRVLAWPAQGILFDVECNGFWAATWGSRPAELADALSDARARLAGLPQLVPVYAHRYLPSGRGTQGHPVLSVWQSDTIFYGIDLADYVTRDFSDAHRGTPVDHSAISADLVPFWADLPGAVRGPWRLGLPD